MSFENFPYSNFHDLNLDWIINQWLEMKKSFATYEQAFIDLKTFVDNYFNNLNVQTEIDNKLNEMYLDGSLLNIIKPSIISETDTWLSSHITNPSNPPLDKSLSLANAASESKTVGDRFSLDETFFKMEIASGNISSAQITIDIDDYLTSDNLCLTITNPQSYASYFTWIVQAVDKGSPVGNLFVQTLLINGGESKSVFFDGTSIQNKNGKYNLILQYSGEHIGEIVGNYNILSAIPITNEKLLKGIKEMNGYTYLVNQTLNTDRLIFTVPKKYKNKKLHAFIRNLSSTDGYFGIYFQNILNIKYTGDKLLKSGETLELDFDLDYYKNSTTVYFGNVNKNNCFIQLYVKNEITDFLNDINISNLHNLSRKYDFTIGENCDFNTIQDFLSSGVKFCTALIVNGTYDVSDLTSPIDLKGNGIKLYGEDKHDTKITFTATASNNHAVIDLSGTSEIHNLTIEIKNNGVTDGSNRPYAVHCDFQYTATNYNTIIDNCILISECMNPLGGGLKNGQNLIIKNCDFIAKGSLGIGNGSLYIHAPSSAVSAQGSLLIEKCNCIALNGDYAIHLPNTSQNFDNYEVCIRNTITSTNGDTELITGKSMFKNYNIGSKLNSNNLLNV